MHRHCKVLCCPRCHYEFVEESAIVNFVKRLIGRRDGVRGGAAAVTAAVTVPVTAPVAAPVVATGARRSEIAPAAKDLLR
jgi:multisubunit Na+/H+ antiporter MnhG subunit